MQYEKTNNEHLTCSLFAAVPDVYLVGVAGLEPAASWSRTMRDTKLRHTP